MVAIIHAHRGTDGVEPICTVLPIAPSTYYEQKARHADPTRQPARAQRDAQLRPEIVRMWQAHRRVYGVKKVWKQLTREAIPVARCTVARLMSTHRPQDLAAVALALNTRPRKTLDWRTPAEALDQFLHATQTGSVATTG
jgi:hypothetical protein